VHSDTGDTRQMAIYACLGVFLLIAARNPGSHRCLIAFAARSSLAHAAVMSVLGFEIASQKTGFLAESAIPGRGRCSPHRARSSKTTETADKHSHGVG
jgi:hypothetical protein